MGGVINFGMSLVVHADKGRLKFKLSESSNDECIYPNMLLYL